MGTFSRTYFADTEPNTGAAYNLISVGSGTTLTRVEVRGAITYVGQSAVVADWFTGGPLFGIQAYPAAESPLHLPTDINNNGMIVCECHVPGEIAATWAPSSDTAAVLVGGPISLTWAGQLPIGTDTAVGLVTGQLTDTEVGWLIFGTCTVWTT